MVRELVHDPILLARKSAPAGREDLDTARDLLDTLTAHKTNYQKSSPNHRML